MKGDVECCDYMHVHQELIDRLVSDMPDEGILADLSELFKVFGDSTRIRILYALSVSEMCVCDIARLLNMTQSAISHQLRVLKQARLVSTRRDGKTIFYALCDEHVKNIFYTAMEHIME